MIEHAIYTWGDSGDTEETWRKVTDPCTICGEASEPTTIQSTFMPGNQFLVVSVQLCSACREELYRAADKWEETDVYASGCLDWIANSFNISMIRSRQRMKEMEDCGQRIRSLIKAFRKRILDWVMEQRVEIEQ